jgi:hypothetical protein
VNPLRYLLQALAFSALHGCPVRARHVGVLARRAIGGWIACPLFGRRA